MKVRKSVRRRRVQHTRRTPPGASPGTLVADPSAVQPVIRVFGYGPDEFEEYEPAGIDELRPLIGKWPVTWINVDGLADVDLVQDLGKTFGLHRLALEDVVNSHQRPKAEDYSDYTFIVTRMIRDDHESATEQVSMFLGKGFLLTFQERPGDVFDRVRDRLRRHGGQIRNQQADFLAYVLLDAVVDAYFPVLETAGERLEDLENAVTDNPSRGQVGRIQELKHDLLMFRRAIWPQREMLNTLNRDTSTHMSSQTRVYLRDCYDHTIQLMDIIETYREIASGLVDIYLSSVSARMNEIMKVLTIIATIFMPLGFIASLYGMNFDPQVSPWNMPELGWYLGYPFALGVMIAVAFGLLVFFYRKGWIFGSARDRDSFRDDRK